MKTKTYETAVIVNAALDDAQIETTVAKIKELIETNGGEIIRFDNWGRKRLAFTVNKSKIGYYAIFLFKAPSTLISKLERFYKLDEQVLRFLTIQLDDDAFETLQNNKVSLEDDLVLDKPELIPEVETELETTEPID